MTRTRAPRATLGDIARDVIDRALRPDAVSMNTPELQKAYGLDDSQVFQVKRYAKAQAAELGLMWAWDPTVGGFRVCPNNAPGVAQAMVGYAYKSWHDQGSGINHLITGASGQGYVSDQMRRNTIRRNEEARDSILQAGIRVRFLETKIKD
jgi:hypothetical protein